LTSFSERRFNLSFIDLNYIVQPQDQPAEPPDGQTDSRAIANA
jgi:hypothetical protein